MVSVRGLSRGARQHQRDNGSECGRFLFTHYLLKQPPVNEKCISAAPWTVFPPSERTTASLNCTHQGGGLVRDT